MVNIPALVQTSDLKTALLKEIVQHGEVQPSVDYDKYVDAFTLLIAPNDEALVVHYVDSHVALVYIAESREVVGLQIEGFERSFLPKHPEVSKVWKLSDTGEALKDFGDLMFTIDLRAPDIAREVVRATEDLLGESGHELAAAFA